LPRRSAQARPISWKGFNGRFEVTETLRKSYMKAE